MGRPANSFLATRQSAGSRSRLPRLEVLEARETPANIQFSFNAGALSLSTINPTTGSTAIGLTVLPGSVNHQLVLQSTEDLIDGGGGNQGKSITLSFNNGGTFTDTPVAFGAALKSISLGTESAVSETVGFTNLSATQFGGSSLDLAINENATGGSDQVTLTNYQAGTGKVDVSTRDIAITNGLSAGLIALASDRGGTISLSGGPVTSAGKLTIDNSGVLTIATDTQVTTGSTNGTGFDQSGTGNVVLGGSISTSDGSISFNGAVSLAASTGTSVLRTVGTKGAAIDFLADLSGNAATRRNLQVVSGSKAVTFAGSVLNVGVLRLQEDAAGMTGKVEFVGIVGASGIATVSRAYEVLFNSSATIAGATTFNNTGALTLGDSAGADLFVFTGGFTNTSGTTILQGDSLQTSNASLSALNLQVKKDSSISTGTGAVTLGSLLVDGVTANLANGSGGISIGTLDSGTLVIDTTGALTVTGLVGYGTIPDLVNIQRAQGGATFQGKVKAAEARIGTANTGTVSFQKSVAVSTLSPLAGSYALRLEADTTVDSASVTFANTGALTLGDSAADSFSFAAGLTAKASSSLTLAGSFSAGDTVELGAATLASAVSIVSGSGLTVGAVASAANALSLEAAGVLALASMADTRGGLRIVDASTATVGALGTSFAGPLTLVDSQGAVSFTSVVKATTLTLTSNQAGGVTFAGSVTADTLSAASGAGDIFWQSDITVSGQATLLTTGTVTLGNQDTDAFAFQGGLGRSGGATELRGSVSTSNFASITIGDIVFNGTSSITTTGGLIALQGAVTLSTGSILGLVSGSGTIALSGDVDGASIGAGALSIGTGGTVTVSGAVGGTKAIGSLTLNSSAGAQFAALNVGNLTLATTAAGAGQLVQLAGDATISSGMSIGGGAYDLSLTGSAVSVAGATVVGNTGRLVLGNANDDSFTFKGGLTATAPTSVALRGTVATVGNTSLSLGDGNTPVSADGVSTIGGTATGTVSVGDITLSTGAGLTLQATGTISARGLQGSTGATGTSLAVNAGGSVSVSGQVERISTLSLDKAVGATFDAVVGSTGTVGLSVGGSVTGTVLFNGASNRFTSADFLGGTYSLTFARAAAFDSAINLLNTGLATFNGITVTGAFTSSSAPLRLQGDLTATGTITTLKSVTIAANVTVNSTNADISLEGATNAAGGSETLTLGAKGQVAIKGLVGNTIAPALLGFGATGSIQLDAILRAGSVATSQASAGAIEATAAIYAPAGVSLAGATVKVTGIDTSAATNADGGAISLAGSTITLTGNLTAKGAASGVGANHKGGAITLTGNVVLDGSLFTLRNDPVTGGISNYVNNPITIQGKLDGQSASGQTLVLEGEGTPITITGAIGSGARLAVFDTGRATAPGSVNLNGSLKSDATAITGNTIALGGAVDVSGALRLNGAGITLANAATVSADSLNILLPLSGTLVIGTGALKIGNALIQSGAASGSIALGASVTAGSVSLAAPVALTQSVVIDTSAASGNVQLASAVNGAGNGLTFRLGSGDLTASASIAGASSLTASAGNFRLAGTEYSATGAVSLTGNLILNGTGSIAIRGGTGITITGDVDDTASANDSSLTLVSTSGTVQVNGNIGATQALAGLILDGSAIVVTGDIGTTSKAGTVGGISLSAPTIRLDGVLYRAGTTVSVAGQRLTLAEASGSPVEIRAGGSVAIGTAMSTTLARDLSIKGTSISLSGVDNQAGQYFQGVSLTGTGAVTLAGSVGITGDFAVSGATGVVIASSLTIDTCPGGAMAGLVNLGSIPVSASATGVDLFIDTRADTGGDISFGAVGSSVGGQALRSLKANSLGTVGNGQININGSSIRVAGGGATGIALDGNVALTANLTLTSPGAAVGLAALGGSVSTTGAKRSLAISTVPVSGSGGAITLGQFADTVGGQLGVLTLDTAGAGSSIAGSLTLLKDLAIGGLTLASAGTVVVGAPIRIDSPGGDVLLGGTSVETAASVVTAGAPGASLTIVTAKTVASGKVAFGVVGNAGGAYLAGLVVDAGIDGVPAIVRLNGRVSVAGDVVLDGTVVVPATRGIDTNKGTVPGVARIATSAGSLSASTGGVLLDIVTELAGKAGGAVALGPVANAGGAFLQAISMKTRGYDAGSTPGSLTLSGNIQLEGSTSPAVLAYDAGNQAGAKVIVVGVVTIDTAVTAATGGAVYLGSGDTSARATITADASGAELSIITDASSQGGDVVFGKADGTGGDWLESFTINAGTQAVIDGAIVTNSGLVGTSNGNGISITGTLNLVVSTTLDTHDASDAAGGGPVTLTGLVSARSTGLGLVIDAGSTAPGQSGGDITLDAVGSGPAYVAGLTARTGGPAGPGRLILRNRILLDGSPTTGASFVFDPGSKGGPGTVLVRADSVIDTEQGGDGPAGDILLGGTTVASATAVITTDAVGIDLALVTEGTASGRVAFGDVDNSGNKYLQTFTADADSPTGTDGLIRVNGIALATSGTAVAGDITLAGSRVEFSSPAVSLSTANGATAVDAGAIDLTGTVAMLAAGAELSLDTSTSTPGRRGGAIRLDAVGASSAYPKALTLSTSGPVAANAGEVFLGGDILLEGGNLILGNVAPVAIERSVVIDTAQAATIAGGVFLGDSSATNATARVRALAPGATLSISTVAATRSGDIALGAVEAGTGLIPAGLSLDTRGGVLGTITLNGDVSTSGPIDLQGRVRLGGSRLLTTGGSGTAYPVSVANLAGSIGSNGTGYDLRIETQGATGNGTVRLGPVVEDQGNLVNDLTVLTGGTGSLTLGGSVTLGPSGGDQGDLTLATTGGFLVIDGQGQPVTISTAGGAVLLGGVSEAATGVVRPASAGERLRINTVGTGSAGRVALGSVEGASGNYLAQFEVDALFSGADRLATPGAINLNTGSINTATSSAAANLITLLGDTRLGASTILSTLGSGSAQGGGIRLEGSVSGALTGIDLGLRTGGGAIRLESIASVRDLTINTSGASAGTVTLAGDITLEGSAANRGDLILANPASVVLNPLDQDAKTIHLATDGGVVLLGGSTSATATATVSASLAGTNLSIVTATGAGSSGAVAFGAFNAAGGQRVNTLTVDSITGALAPAQVRLNGDMALGQGGLAISGVVVLGATRVITSQNGDIRLAAGGGSLSALASGFDLALVSGGGAIGLGEVGNAGGGWINDLLADARGAGATFGDFVISGSILLDANGADAASLTYWGDDVRLNTGRITIDTLQSATGPGGDVLLGAGDSTARAELTGMTSDVSLLVDTRGTTANGQVALGSVTNGGGGPDRFYLGSIGVTSSSSATAGGIFLNGSTIQTDGVALFGAATRDAEVWLSGAITAAGNLTIDTQASSGTAGDVVLAGSLALPASGAALSIDTSSSTDVVASGLINLSEAALSIAGAGKFISAGGSTGGQSVRLGAITVAGATVIQSGSGAVSAPSQTNDFIGSVTLSSTGSVFLRDANTLVLGNVALGAGGTSFLAGTGIGQAAGTAIRQAETAAIDFRAGSDGIALAGANNDFLGPVTLASSAGGSIQVNDSTALNLATVSLDPTREGTLTITAKGEITQEPGSAITTGTGQVSVQTETAAITLASGGNAFNGPVAARNVGAAAITLFGSGDLRLSRVAMTADRAGTLSLTANGAITQTAGGTITTGTGTVTLKSAFSDITLANASSNAFNGGVSFRAVGATTLTAKGALAIDSGVAPTARLVAEGGNLTDNGAITLTGTGSFETKGSGSSIILDALSVGGVVSLATAGAGGDATVVNQGPLAFQGTVGGILTVRSVTGAVTDAGAVRFGSKLVVGSASMDSVLDTVLTSSQAAGSLVFDGPGKLLISADSTYGGPTNIRAGVVEVTGKLASSQAIVNGGTLTGTGSLAGIVSLAAVAPGLATPGILTSVGNFAMATGSNLTLRFRGGTPGTGHDQVVVTSSVILNNPVLNLRVQPFFNPGSIAQFTLIRNQGPSPVQGQFRNLPEGAPVSLGGVPFTISYRGGTLKRDVVLNRVSKTPVVKLGLPVVAASDSGVTVTALDANDQRTTVQAFPAGTPGGVRVAAGMHAPEGQQFVVVANGPGTPAQVRVINLVTGAAVASFTPFPGWTGGLNIATGDVNKDGYSDFVVARDGGSASVVNVYSGKTLGLIKSFTAFPAPFTGGVRVACADVNGDGLADVIAASGAGMRGTVRVFSSSTKPALLFKLSSTTFVGPATFTGGLFIASADLTGDGKAELIVGNDRGGTPQVSVIRGGAKLGAVTSFNAMADSFTGGIRVGVASTGDLLPSIVTGTGPGIAAQVNLFDGRDYSRLDTLFSLADGLDGVRV